MAVGFGTASSLSAASLALYNEPPRAWLRLHGEAGFLHYRIVNLIAAATICAAVVMMTGLTARAASPAEAVVRGAIDSMKALPATEGHPGARRILLDSIDNSLALDLLAQQALGAQWGKLGVAERHHFVAVFTESLEKLAYPRAAAALSAVKVNYIGTDKQASGEVVRTVIANEGGGQMPIDFEVARRGARWQITDAMMDGMSLSKVVSTRIQQSLQDQGYQKMLDELQHQNAMAGAPDSGKQTSSDH
jgi:ABC-type transporter MlaC component